MQRLAHLLPDVPGIDPACEVSALVMDSREVVPGAAFVAIAGFGAHGLSYVDAARANGAAAILFEPPAPEAHPAPSDAIAVPGLRTRLGELGHRFHGRATESMDVVGVTGTNGKTSIVQLVAQAWTRLGTRCGTIGTLGAGLVGEIEPTGFTTPLVLRLHALVAAMKARGADALAMEVSSHALDQGRVDGIRFDIAVFSNLTRDHLDYHGTMAAYGAAKARLFGWPGLRAAVVNIDDPFGAQLAAVLPAGVSRMTVSSCGNDAVLRAEAVTLDARGIAFELVQGETRVPVRSTLLGRFNVDNLLAVAGVLRAQGHALPDIATLLAGLEPIAGRMNRLGGDGGRPLVVVDYAHTPDALEHALGTLRAHATGRVLCVFGCGGERDAGKRPEMGAIAARLADVAIVTDDNPRGEDGDAIVAQILAGMPEPGHAIVQRDRRAAIAAALRTAGPDDIVLIAGKGHEAYQDVAGVQHPFDDTIEALRALENAA